jgi:arylsulfatase
MLPLHVDDTMAAQRPRRTMSGRHCLCGEGLSLGSDSGDSVSKEYGPDFPFANGEVTKGDLWPDVTLGTSDRD